MELQQGGRLDFLCIRHTKCVPHLNLWSVLDSCIETHTGEALTPLCNWGSEKYHSGGSRSKSIYWTLKRIEKCVSKTVKAQSSRTQEGMKRLCSLFLIRSWMRLDSQFSLHWSLCVRRQFHTCISWWNMSSISVIFCLDPVAPYYTETYGRPVCASLSTASFPSAAKIE